MKPFIKTLKNVIHIILIVITFKTYAQNNIDLSDVQIEVSRNTSLPPNIKGSPYITKDFSLVKLSIIENKIYNGRFNAFNGDMEIESQGKTIALDASKDIEVLFTKTNKLYKTCTYKQKNSKTKRGFLVVLSELDSLGLLKLEKINFIEKKIATSSYDRAKPAEFRKDSDSYYIKIDNQIIYLPTRKKNFLNTFPKYKSKLKSYIKKEKLNTKNENDLIIIINYLNQLKRE